MSTYLVLCQDMARDVGIPGTGPSAVDYYKLFLKKRMLWYSLYSTSRSRYTEPVV